MTPTDDFDSWLDAELDKGYARSIVQSRPGIGGDYDVISRHRGFHLVSPAGLPFAGKAAIGLAAAILSLGAIGAAAATAVTHSTSPEAWGQQVNAAVADCKKALKPGEHGIGQCVSAFARQHGAAQRAEDAQDKQSNESKDANDPNHANGKNPSHPVVSPSPGFEARSDSSHGQGGQHKPDKSHGPGTEGKSDSHPTPKSH